MSETIVTPTAFQFDRGLDPRRYRDRPHGTRLRYLAGCRCMLCRAANSRYECERAAARRRGRGNGIVDASRARAHLLRLSRAGVGRDAVRHASDVSRTVLQGIAAGRKTMIRAETERRILAVDASARADGSLVPAGRTWQRIDELLEEGYTKAFIARALGAKTPALQVRRDRILARTAVKVERLYRSLTGVVLSQAGDRRCS
jgi:hypothetical protein